MITFPLAADDLARFWASIDKNGPLHPYDTTLGPCWIWKRSTPGFGYGSFKVQGESVNAHRTAFILTNGTINNPKMFVCHSCDNAPCCNPAHLFLGTSADNTEDKRSKGRCAQGATHYSRTNPERLARGVRNAAAKLNDDAVRSIRALRYGGLSLQRIADRFSVSERTVGRVVHREKWRHVQ